MLSVYDFPKVLNLWRDCDFLFEELVLESNKAFHSGKFLPWPEQINLAEKWQVCGVKWQGKYYAEQMLPILTKVIKPFEDLVWNAGYSVMTPDAEIAPHQGYTKDVLRFHFGLHIPKGDCGIQIEGVPPYTWKPRGCLLFDDTVTHMAWNRTKGHRFILLLDLKRDCL